jgi:uncharacterized repeat protein (TIGR03803 family)
MNYVRQQDKMLRAFAAFVTAMVVLTLTVAAVPAQAQTPTTLYSFPGGAEPQNVNVEAIAQGRDGNLYMSSELGGTGGTCAGAGCGTVFNITPTGTPTVVFEVGAGGGPFGIPGAYSGETLGTDGNFYGTLYQGGTSGKGEVYKVTTGGVLTSLHSFAGTGDGSLPYSAPIESTSGIYYGTTTSNGGVNSTAYSVTSGGVFTTLHTFTGTDGQNVYAPLVQGTDGNFYGSASAGGTSSFGVIFKMTAAGTVTVLHNFAGTDGSGAYYPMIQASDGNLYGTAYSGGTSGAGVIFKITTSGTYTVIHNLNGTSDGNGPAYGLVQATDGKLYGVTTNLNVGNNGTIFRVTTSGTFTTLYSFTLGADGGDPLSPLIQHTNGLLYGTTDVGGTTNPECFSTVNVNGQNVIFNGCGVFFSLNIGAKAFINLESTSGKVGSKVSILGQGFSSSSVVKFGGGVVAAHTLTGTTYISATVPAGATDGKVTVTTGSSTLTSRQTFTVHDSWSSGATMPTARMGAFTGTVGTSIYVIGGIIEGGALVGVNEIYNTKTNLWTTGTPDPTTRWAGASAVVSGIVYLFGGSNGDIINLVEAYNPATDTWSTKSPMPTNRQGAAAVVDGNIVYVIGGQNSSIWLATVESYNTTTDTWTTEASLLAARSFPAAGLLGTTPVAADGGNSLAYTGDNESYNTSLNTWTTLTADPTPRGQGCFSAISGQLYVAGGTGNSGQLSLNEAYSSTKKSWTTLTPMPNGVSFAGSAQAGGLLYCFGGGIYPSAAYNYLQIYQP